MPIPAIAAIGGGIAKGASLAKGAMAGLGGMEKLMLLLFGGDIALKGLGQLTGLNEYGTQKAQVDLAGKQVGMQAGMGRREEARTDKLMRQLMRENEKKYDRSERTSLKQSNMELQSQQNEMAMAILMAISGMNSQQAEIGSRPRPSTGSMLSMMR